MISHANTIFL
jgi:20S proteasome subunit alpha 7